MEEVFLYSFHSEISQNQNFISKNMNFIFDQESDANRMVQIMAGYANVPAYDIMGNVLPGIPPETIT